MKAELFAEPVAPVQFPSTRYQGSKAKLADWIWSSIEFIDFDSVLDAFGGTGSVAYRLKREGKQVIYNDYLRFNYLIGLALIENNAVHLQQKELDSIQAAKPTSSYRDFIERTFKGIYYYDEENRWLDIVVQNIRAVKNRYKRALLCASLFQACIIKRPFNLFHRSNLYIRSADVKRNFGNKTTWDKPFVEHFQKFAYQMSNAVFDNARSNKALCRDVFSIDARADLVYLDPPYVSRRRGSVDYRDFYHFLEGITDYSGWADKIDWQSRNLRPSPVPSVWNDARRIEKAFAELIDKFRASIIVISYRNDGIPCVADLRNMLKKFKKHVLLRVYRDYKYVLSRSYTDEILLIGY